MKKKKKLFLFGAVCALSLCCALSAHAIYEYELREAAKCGDIDNVKTYFEPKKIVCVDSKDYKGRSALYLALKHENKDVVEYLIKEANASLKLNYKHTILSMVGKANWDDLYAYLHTRGLRCDDPRGTAFTFLTHGQFELFDFMVKRYPQVKQNIKDFKRGLAEYIYKYRNIKDDDICLLLEKHLLFYSNKLYTYAFVKNYTNVLEMMKKASTPQHQVKLDFSFFPKETNNIVKSALLNDNEEMLGKLIDAGMSPNDLWSSLCYLDFYNNKILQTIQFLIDKGMDINFIVSDNETMIFTKEHEKIPCQNTILFQAIFEHNVNAVRFLLEKGANIYVKIDHFDFQKSRYAAKRYNAIEYAKWFADDYKKSNKERNKEREKRGEMPIDSPSPAEKVYSILEEYAKTHPNPNPEPESKKSLFSKIFK